MNDLANAATEFWNFLWPAAIHLGVTIGIVLFLAPRLRTYLKTRCQKLPVRRTVRFLRSKTAEALGLPKLLPVVLVFLFLLVIVILTDVADIVGDATPPTLVWSSPADHVSLARSADLLLIWQTLPSGTTVNDLSSHIKEQWKATGQNSGYKFRERRVGRAGAIMERMKFYFLLALLALGLGRRLGTGWRLLFKRFVVLAALLTSVYGVSIAYAVYSYSRLVEGQIIVARKWAVVQEPKYKHTQEELDRRKELLQRHQTDGDSWWGFGLPSWYW